MKDLSDSISNFLSLPNQAMQIPVEVLRANGILWNNTVIATLLNGGHLNPNLVMRNFKIKWRIVDCSDIVHAGHNHFVCRFVN
ncbi:hypothetical protein FRX31_025911 [Thalictrum thalictroides]|uniref:Uncharacterized protein n=1 Tax=Thalictrum thalictroides TaxID=46969 RepID=A0A7J6VHD3_THATH|nr:hypothetical protein FRX31_025911 [Thalictrum thalictroides]